MPEKGRFTKRDKENEKQQRKTVQQITLIKKQVPAYSFPQETKRVFAELDEPAQVPSPDKYFREPENTNIETA